MCGKRYRFNQRLGGNMKISELKAGTGNVEIAGEIVNIETPREINKMGRVLRVANATIKDDSGTITLVLWNDDIDKVQAGNQVKITNGYVNTWQDKTQLTLGKFGKMDIVE
jgi:replication factor A1